MTRHVDCSFVIPVRNEGPALEETLAHLDRVSEGRSFEIIVVDDDSAEPQYNLGSHTLPVIYHRNKSRQGVARARNIGASLASGKLLFFLDAHVCFSNNFMNEFIGSGVMNGTRISGCTTCLIHDFDQFVKLARGTSEGFELDAIRIYGWFLFFSDFPQVSANRLLKSVEPIAVPYVGACALALSRDLFFDLGGFDDGLIGYGNLEDAELAMRCWAFGEKVELLPHVVCYHYSALAPAKSGPEPTTQPFEHPRYDGSLWNALRVMYLHFPKYQFEAILAHLNQHRLVHGECVIEFEKLKTAIDPRALWVESRRKRSREWLMERLTTI